MKKVFVNNKSIELSLSAGVNDLLTQLGYSHSRGLAVAINGNVIPKSTWNSTEIKNEDAILLIKATQGG